MSIRLTKAGEYAIRGMVYLAEQPENRVITINEVAAKRGIPRGFLAKIFQSLAKAGLVHSAQGNLGGFMLSKPKDRINLREIVEAVDGPIHLQYCLAHKGECAWEMTCLARQAWQKAQEKLLEVLEEADLASLVQDQGRCRETASENRYPAKP